MKFLILIEKTNSWKTPLSIHHRLLKKLLASLNPEKLFETLLKIYGINSINGLEIMKKNSLPILRVGLPVLRLPLMS